MASRDSGPRPRPSTYVFDNRAPEALRRFANLSALWDPWTVRHLEQVGITTGWSCLEVGAGGGTIARWMSDQVGRSGRVLATDLDARHLAGLRAANIKVLRHDISTDELPLGAFDLIHTRLVLQHVPGRYRGLKTMVASLKPDGWIVLEDYLGRSPLEPFGSHRWAVLTRKVERAIRILIRKRGGDPYFGRRLVPSLAREGLHAVHAEARAVLDHGGGPLTKLLLANIEQIKHEAIHDQLLTEAEFKEVCDMLRNPEYSRFSWTMLTAWAQRTS
jgi:SAM-dependent methyltransferase